MVCNYDQKKEKKGKKESIQSCMYDQSLKVKSKKTTEEKVKVLKIIEEREKAQCLWRYVLYCKMPNEHYCNRVPKEAHTRRDLEFTLFLGDGDSEVIAIGARRSLVNKYFKGFIGQSPIIFRNSSYDPHKPFIHHSLHRVHLISGISPESLDYGDLSSHIASTLAFY